MTQNVNRQWRLASRPSGMLEESNFTWAEEPAPTLKVDGEILVRNLYLSVDPAQRGWTVRETYVPMIQIGEVMRAHAGGKVVESRHPDFAPGDLVTGLFGWQDYAVVNPGKLVATSKVPPGVPLPLALNALGVTGLTGYFGMLEVGRIAANETVVVSGAAGATGSAAAQIAKIKGCRVIGIAGGKEKCAWLTGELGLDAAIDYKSEDVTARLGALCPNGIDVFFDNVGGAILDAALEHLAMRGRVVLCGAISRYNEEKPSYGLKNYFNLIIKRGRMEGFIVLDYLSRAQEALQEMSGWVSSGKLKNPIDVAEGLENAPKTLRRLFTGENLGKQLLKIAEP